MTKSIHLREKFHVSGPALAKYRGIQGVTQADIAKILGIERGTYVNWEARERVSVTKKQMELLVETLKCSEDDLMRVTTSDVAQAYKDIIEGRTPYVLVLKEDHAAAKVTTQRYLDMIDKLISDRV